jgi:hypothetical protein
MMSQIRPVDVEPTVVVEVNHLVQHRLLLFDRPNEQKQNSNLGQLSRSSLCLRLNV